ncbi:Bug family tripartite tricarboxylate transporter substrate binding protein [Ottowia sp. VDI28]|uniref:Bug family tripartite tricarboxylate transporter substrate binding protein n=1 Tax=Ottowia sp. VDI28 TaxID=3133968 RepID=UPI003C2EE8FA
MHYFHTGLTRRQTLAFATASLALPAWAQNFPTAGKPVRIIVPAPPGGPADILARAIGNYLGPQLDNVPVIVESKPGGASVPAALATAHAPADGHTIMLGLNTTHTQVPHMFSKPPYDPFKDFTPITQVYRNGSVLVAHPSLPVNDLKELVAYSKAQANPVPGGSPGVGTNGHFYIEMLNQAGAKLSHIGYKGSADAMRDLLGGFTKLQFDAPVTSLPHIQAGRLKALAVTGPTRIKQLPNVPTAHEQGFPALDITGWMGFFGPARLPAGTVERLNQALVAVIRRPEIRAQFEPMGLDLTGTTQAEFAAIVRSDYEVWGKIIKQTGIKLDQ